MAVADCVSARTVLWWLIFTGTAVNYVIRMSINIAIIGMVKERSDGGNATPAAGRCYNVSESVSAGNASLARASSLVDTDQDKVEWDEYQQNLVLGASFWLYWVTQVPGGVLTQKYGTKLVLGSANYAMCLLGLLIPFATFSSFPLLIAIRVLQGLVGGFVWPAMHAVTAAWIPPNERGKFISAYTGNSLGTALAFPLCGQIVYWFGWRAVFYVTGVLGTVWYIAWHLLMFDSPDKHPRISQEERRYIEEHLATSHSHHKLSTPWKAILTSVPVWLVVITQWGNLWCLNLALTQAPTYLYTIHGWNIQMTGVMSGIPHVMRIGCALGSSAIFDMLLQKNYLSRTAVRKVAVAMCCLGQGLNMVGMAFSGCNAVMAMAFMMMAISIQSLDTSGQMASLVDLSPNFASILLGLCNAATVLTGFAAPTLVGMLTKGNWIHAISRSITATRWSGSQRPVTPHYKHPVTAYSFTLSTSSELEQQTTSAWQQVFLISAAMAILPDIIHAFFGTSDLQKWNSPEGEATEMKTMNEEMQKLNTDAEHTKEAEDEKQ